jgi:hypothetical protein
MLSSIVFSVTLKKLYLLYTTVYIVVIIVILFFLFHFELYFFQTCCDVKKTQLVFFK